MALTIPEALRSIKHKIQDYVPPRLVERLLRECAQQERQRALPAVVTTYLFLQQVLHGNTAVAALRHLSGLDFTDAAYCQARGRLPLAFFKRLQRAVTGQLQDEADAQLEPGDLWRGHRLFLLDGSSFSMADSPELQEAFGQPGNQRPGCGFPVAHLLTLFGYHSGFLLKALAAPLRTHDLAHAAAMHPALQPGDVLVADRAFGSFAHLALCHGRGLHAVFRAHQRQIIDFRPHRPYAHAAMTPRQAKGLPRSRWVQRLGKDDQLVQYFKPKGRPRWMSAEDYAALPAALLVREVRFRIGGRGRRVREVTLVTTLLDVGRYPAAAVAALYERRWQVEVNLRHVKETLGLDVLRCQTLPGVLKELHVFVIVYNLVRRVMRQAARQQGASVHRVSFIDALRWLRQAAPGDVIPALRVNPERKGRVQPRVRKRRPKQYPRMTRPRDELRQALLC